MHSLLGNDHLNVVLDFDISFICIDDDTGIYLNNNYKHLFQLSFHCSGTRCLNPSQHSDRRGRVQSILLEDGALSKHRA